MGALTGIAEGHIESASPSKSGHEQTCRVGSFVPKLNMSWLLTENAPCVS
jgi:hypothetical protein